MHQRRVMRLFLAAIMVMVSTSLVGCGGEELSSTWCDRLVVIDGVDAEWEGAVSYIDDKNVAIGLLNDEEYIHICLATVDFEVVQQVLSSGMTVWFDPQGGKEKTFGVIFPLGMRSSRENMDRKSTMKKDPPSALSKGERPNSENMWKRFEESEKEMVIIGPEKGRRCRRSIINSQELQVAMSYSQGKLVYEMRIPMVRDDEHPDAIGLEDGHFVGVGFEVPEPDVEKMKAGFEGVGPGKGRARSRGGGKHGGGMRSGPEPGGERPEPLELWTKVRLASAESGNRYQ